MTKSAVNSQFPNTTKDTPMKTRSKVRRRAHLVNHTTETAQTKCKEKGESNMQWSLTLSSVEEFDVSHHSDIQAPKTYSPSVSHYEVTDEMPSTW